MTLIIGVFSWGMMPPGPTQTANWFRGKKGWFTEREELIMVNRLLRDDPTKGDMNNRYGYVIFFSALCLRVLPKGLDADEFDNHRQAVGPKLLWKAVKDWEQWPLYIIGLLAYVPPVPISNYLSYILRQLGFSVFQANLLAIPSQFLFAVQLLLITWISHKVDERSILSSLSNWWFLPWFIGLLSIRPNANPWIRYVLLSGLLSYPYCHAILVGWNARNSNAVRTRAVSAALYNMFVQTGNIIGTNIYRDEDSPLYYQGNKVLVGIAGFNVILFILVKGFYIWRNRVRERQWNTLTPEQKRDYLETTEDEGMKRLDFRFAH